MNSTNSTVSDSTTRRKFLANSGTLLAAAAVAGTARPGYTAENNTIKIALVGCGGRGTGAAVNALSTQGPTKLWAVADVFENRLNSSLNGLKKKFPDKVDVSPERQFLGLDGFKKAIDLLDKTDVVLLTTPPAFRPQHVEYAVQKGVNVFMEKSFGVDTPGSLRILRAGEEAKKKNLKVAGGLMSRHNKPLAAAIEKIHGGLIGDVSCCWAYRMHGPVGSHSRDAGMSEMAYQIRNYSCFTWLNGTFFLDWLIHNIDICCWVKDALPISAQGMGGRQVRVEPDQLFDHYGVEYTFPDGARLFAQGRHIVNCYNFFGDIIHGTKGSAVLGEGIKDPKIYKSWNQNEESLIWKFEGDYVNAYQYEHDLFFDAIRNDKPYNEAERCVKTNLVAIMGRMACECGNKVTWDETMASTMQLAPGLDNLTMDGPAPVMPDDKGKYPVAMPGKTKVL